MKKKNIYFRVLILKIFTAALIFQAHPASANDALKAFENAYRSEKKDEKAESKAKSKLEKSRNRKEQKRNNLKAQALYEKALMMYKDERHVIAENKLKELRDFLESANLRKKDRKRVEKQRLILERYIRRKADKRKSEALWESERFHKKKAGIEEKQKQKRTHKFDEDYFMEQEAKRKKYEKKVRNEKAKSAYENKLIVEQQVKMRQAELKGERERIEKTLSRDIERLYNRAVELHRAKAYMQAKELFSEINIFRPDYKSTKSYLSRIDKDIESEIEKSRSLDIKQNKKSKEELVTDTLDMYR